MASASTTPEPLLTQEIDEEDVDTTSRQLNIGKDDHFKKQTDFGNMLQAPDEQTRELGYEERKINLEGNTVYTDGECFLHPPYVDKIAHEDMDKNSDYFPGVSDYAKSATQHIEEKVMKIEKESEGNSEITRTHDGHSENIILLEETVDIPVRVSDEQPQGMESLQPVKDPETMRQSDDKKAEKDGDEKITFSKVEDISISQTSSSPVDRQESIPETSKDVEELNNRPNESIDTIQEQNGFENDGKYNSGEGASNCLFEKDDKDTGESKNSKVETNDKNCATNIHCQGEDEESIKAVDAFLVQIEPSLTLKGSTETAIEDGCSAREDKGAESDSVQVGNTHEQIDFGDIHQSEAVNDHETIVNQSYEENDYCSGKQDHNISEIPIESKDECTHIASEEIQAHNVGEDTSSGKHQCPTETEDSNTVKNGVSSYEIMGMETKIKDLYQDKTIEVVHDETKHGQSDSDEIISENESSTNIVNKVDQGTKGSSSNIHEETTIETGSEEIPENQFFEENHSHSKKPDPENATDFTALTEAKISSEEGIVEVEEKSVIEEQLHCSDTHDQTKIAYDVASHEVTRLEIEQGIQNSQDINAESESSEAQTEVNTYEHTEDVSHKKNVDQGLREHHHCSEIQDQNLLSKDDSTREFQTSQVHKENCLETKDPNKMQNSSSYEVARDNIVPENKNSMNTVEDVDQEINAQPDSIEVQKHEENHGNTSSDENHEIGATDIEEIVNQSFEGTVSGIEDIDKVIVEAAMPFTECDNSVHKDDCSMKSSNRLQVNEKILDSDDKDQNEVGQQHSSYEIKDPDKRSGLPSHEVSRVEITPEIGDPSNIEEKVDQEKEDISYTNDAQKETSLFKNTGPHELYETKASSNDEIENASSIRSQSYSGKQDQKSTEGSKALTEVQILASTKYECINISSEEAQDKIFEEKAEIEKQQSRSETKDKDGMENYLPFDDDRRPEIEQENESFIKIEENVKKEIYAEPDNIEPQNNDTPDEQIVNNDIHGTETIKQGHIVNQILQNRDSSNEKQEQDSVYTSIPLLEVQNPVSSQDADTRISSEELNCSQVEEENGFDTADHDVSPYEVKGEEVTPEDENYNGIVVVDQDIDDPSDNFDVQKDKETHDKSGLNDNNEAQVVKKLEIENESSEECHSCIGKQDQDDDDASRSQNPISSKDVCSSIFGEKIPVNEESQSDKKQCTSANEDPNKIENEISSHEVMRLEIAPENGSSTNTVEKVDQDIYAESLSIEAQKDQNSDEQTVSNKNYEAEAQKNERIINQSYCESDSCSETHHQDIAEESETLTEVETPVLSNDECISEEIQVQKVEEEEEIKNQKSHTKFKDQHDTEYGLPPHEVMGLVVLEQNANSMKIEKDVNQEINAQSNSIQAHNDNKTHEETCSNEIHETEAANHEIVNQSTKQRGIFTESQDHEIAPEDCISIISEEIQARQAEKEELLETEISKQRINGSYEVGEVNIVPEIGSLTNIEKDMNQVIDSESHNIEAHKDEIRHEQSTSTEFYETEAVKNEQTVNKFPTVSGCCTGNQDQEIGEESTTQTEIDIPTSRKDVSSWNSTEELKIGEVKDEVIEKQQGSTETENQYKVENDVPSHEATLEEVQQGNISSQNMLQDLNQEANAESDGIESRKDERTHGQVFSNKIHETEAINNEEIINQSMEARESSSGKQARDATPLSASTIKALDTFPAKDDFAEISSEDIRVSQDEEEFLETDGLINTKNGASSCYVKGVDIISKNEKIKIIQDDNQEINPSSDSIDVQNSEETHSAGSNENHETQEVNNGNNINQISKENTDFVGNLGQQTVEEFTPLLETENFVPCNDERTIISNKQNEESMEILKRNVDELKISKQEHKCDIEDPNRVRDDAPTDILRELDIAPTKERSINTVEDTDQDISAESKSIEAQMDRQKDKQIPTTEIEAINNEEIANPSSSIHNSSNGMRDREVRQAAVTEGSTSSVKEIKNTEGEEKTILKEEQTCAKFKEQNSTEHGVPLWEAKGVEILKENEKSILIVEEVTRGINAQTESIVEQKDDKIQERTSSNDICEAESLINNDEIVKDNPEVSNSCSGKQSQVIVPAFTPLMDAQNNVPSTDEYTRLSNEEFQTSQVDEEEYLESAETNDCVSSCKGERVEIVPQKSIIEYANQDQTASLDTNTAQKDAEKPDKSGSNKSHETHAINNADIVSQHSKENNSCLENRDQEIVGTVTLLAETVNLIQSKDEHTKLPSEAFEVSEETLVSEVGEEVERDKMQCRPGIEGPSEVRDDDSSNIARGFKSEPKSESPTDIVKNVHQDVNAEPQSHEAPIEGKADDKTASNEIHEVDAIKNVEIVNQSSRMSNSCNKEEDQEVAEASKMLTGVENSVAIEDKCTGTSRDEVEVGEVEEKPMIKEQQCATETIDQNSREKGVISCEIKEEDIQHEYVNQEINDESQSTEGFESKKDNKTLAQTDSNEICEINSVNHEEIVNHSLNEDSCSGKQEQESTPESTPLIEAQNHVASKDECSRLSKEIQASQAKEKDCLETHYHNETRHSISSNEDRVVIVLQKENFVDNSEHVNQDKNLELHCIEAQKVTKAAELSNTSEIDDIEAVNEKILNHSSRESSFCSDEKDEEIVEGSRKDTPVKITDPSKAERTRTSCEEIQMRDDTVEETISLRQQSSEETDDPNQIEFGLPLYQINGPETEHENQNLFNKEDNVNQKFQDINVESDKDIERTVQTDGNQHGSEENGSCSGKQDQEIAPPSTPFIEAQNPFPCKHDYTSISGEQENQNEQDQCLEMEDTNKLAGEVHQGINAPSERIEVQNHERSQEQTCFNKNHEIQMIKDIVKQSCDKSDCFIGINEEIAEASVQLAETENNVPRTDESITLITNEIQIEEKHLVNEVEKEAEIEKQLCMSEIEDPYKISSVASSLNIAELENVTEAENSKNIDKKEYQDINGELQRDDIQYDETHEQSGEVINEEILSQSARESYSCFKKQDQEIAKVSPLITEVENPVPTKDECTKIPSEDINDSAGQKCNLESKDQLKIEKEISSHEIKSLEIDQPIETFTDKVEDVNQGTNAKSHGIEAQNDYKTHEIHKTEANNYEEIGAMSVPLLETNIPIRSKDEATKIIVEETSASHVKGEGFPKTEYPNKTNNNNFSIMEGVDQDINAQSDDTEVQKDETTDIKSSSNAEIGRKKCAESDLRIVGQDKQIAEASAPLINGENCFQTKDECSQTSKEDEDNDKIEVKEETEINKQQCSSEIEIAEKMISEVASHEVKGMDINGENCFQTKDECSRTSTEELQDNDKIEVKEETEINKHQCSSETEIAEKIISEVASHEVRGTDIVSDENAMIIRDNVVQEIHVKSCSIDAQNNHEARDEETGSDEIYETKALNNDENVNLSTKEPDPFHGKNYQESANASTLTAKDEINIPCIDECSRISGDYFQVKEVEDAVIQKPQCSNDTEIQNKVENDVPSYEARGVEIEHEHAMATVEDLIKVFQGINAESNSIKAQIDEISHEEIGSNMIYEAKASNDEKTMNQSQIEEDGAGKLSELNQDTGGDMTSGTIYEKKSETDQDSVDVKHEEIFSKTTVPNKNCEDANEATIDTQQIKVLQANEPHDQLKEPPSENLEQKDGIVSIENKDDNSNAVVVLKEEKPDITSSVDLQINKEEYIADESPVPEPRLVGAKSTPSNKINRKSDIYVGSSSSETNTVNNCLFLEKSEQPTHMSAQYDSESVLISGKNVELEQSARKHSEECTNLGDSDKEKHLEGAYHQLIKDTHPGKKNLAEHRIAICDSTSAEQGNETVTEEEKDTATEFFPSSIDDGTDFKTNGQRRAEPKENKDIDQTQKAEGIESLDDTATVSIKGNSITNWATENPNIPKEESGEVKESIAMDISEPNKNQREGENEIGNELKLKSNQKKSQNILSGVVSKFKKAMTCTRIPDE